MVITFRKTIPLLVGADLLSTGSKGSKRKIVSSTDDVGVAEAYLAFDWKELGGRAGGLEKLTINNLKVTLFVARP